MKLLKAWNKIKTNCEFGIRSNKFQIVEGIRTKYFFLVLILSIFILKFKTLARKTERTVCSILGAGLNIWFGYEKSKAKNEKYTFGKVLTRGLLGAGGGLMVAEIFGEPNDTVNYTLYDKREKVYEGITLENRIDKRPCEHRSAGKKFTRFVFDDAKPRSEALSLEKKRICKFRPNYNIHHNS